MGDGKAEESGGGQKNADGGYQPRAEFSGQPIGKKAGNNGAGGDDHGDKPCEGEGNAELPVHDRPGGADEGVGKAKANKSGVNNSEQKRIHSNPSISYRLSGFRGRTEDFPLQKSRHAIRRGSPLSGEKNRKFPRLAKTLTASVPFRQKGTWPAGGNSCFSAFFCLLTCMPQPGRVGALD